MIDEEKIKEAFSKIKQEMDSLKSEISALRQELQALKLPQKANFSTGNEGVPTNKQTNKPTHNTSPTHLERIPTHEVNITSMVESLRTDLKKKFKLLTKQEFLVFSVLFTVEKEQNPVTYKDIAQHLGLSEASIRDYIMKIINKGIPVIKERVNNKTVILRIPTDLRNISTLESLMKLRNNGNFDEFTVDKI